MEPESSTPLSSRRAKGSFLKNTPRSYSMEDFTPIKRPERESLLNDEEAVNMSPVALKKSYSNRITFADDVVPENESEKSPSKETAKITQNSRTDTQRTFRFYQPIEKLFVRNPKSLPYEKQSRLQRSRYKYSKMSTFRLTVRFLPETLVCLSLIFFLGLCRFYYNDDKQDCFSTNALDEDKAYPTIEELRADGFGDQRVYNATAIFKWLTLIGLAIMVWHVVLVLSIITSIKHMGVAVVCLHQLSYLNLGVYFLTVDIIRRFPAISLCSGDEGQRQDFYPQNEGEIFKLIQVYGWICMGMFFLFFCVNKHCE